MASKAQAIHTALLEQSTLVYVPFFWGCKSSTGNAPLTTFQVANSYLPAMSQLNGYLPSETFPKPSGRKRCFFFFFFPRVTESFYVMW